MREMSKYKILTERQWPKPPPGMDTTIVVLPNAKFPLAKGLKWLEPTTSLVGSSQVVATIATFAGFIGRNSSEQVIRSMRDILTEFSKLFVVNWNLMSDSGRRIGQ